VSRSGPLAKMGRNIQRRIWSEYVSSRKYKTANERCGAKTSQQRVYRDVSVWNPPSQLGGNKRLASAKIASLDYPPYPGLALRNTCGSKSEIALANCHGDARGRYRNHISARTDRIARAMRPSTVRRSFDIVALQSLRQRHRNERDLQLLAAHVFGELSRFMRFSEGTSSHARYILGKVRDQYGMSGIRGEADLCHIGSEMLSHAQHA
jgi:hypothetical protein